jgi:hypothetical protein
LHPRLFVIVKIGDACLDRTLDEEVGELVGRREIERQFREQR